MSAKSDRLSASYSNAHQNNPGGHFRTHKPPSIFLPLHPPKLSTYENHFPDVKKMVEMNDALHPMEE